VFKSSKPSAKLWTYMIQPEQGDEPMRSTHKLIGLFLGLSLSQLPAAVSQQVTSPAPSQTPRTVPSASSSENFGTTDAYKRFDNALKDFDHSWTESQERLKQLDVDFAGVEQIVDDQLKRVQDMERLTAQDGQLANTIHEWQNRAIDVHKRTKNERLAEAAKKISDQFQQDLDRLNQQHTDFEQLIQELRRAKPDIQDMARLSLLDEAHGRINGILNNFQNVLDTGKTMLNDLRGRKPIS